MTAARAPLEVSTPTSSDRIRLHITPFNAELVDRFIPASLQPLATNLSFHTVQTFPERGFGFVELPVMEAQKLKKKFGGTTLKGAKVKIEEAKPEKSSKSKKRKSSEVGDDAAGEEVKEKKKKIKIERMRRSEGVIPGHELEEGRRVKRGWEGDAASKRKAEKAEKAGKTNKEDDEGLKNKKGLFKMTVPPNTVPVKRKASKEKEGIKAEKSRANTAGGKSVLVKEFKNATKLANVRKTAQTVPALQYEDGKGWVDEEGIVVEPETASARRKRSVVSAKSETSSITKKAAQQKKDVKTRASSKSKPESQPESDSEKGSGLLSESSSELSSSSEETSSDEAASEEDSSDDEASKVDSSQENNTRSGHPISSTTEHDTADPDSQPPAQAEAVSKEVHPLEVLFKRPAPKASEDKKSSKPAPINTSFSFFAGNESADGNHDDDREDSATQDHSGHPPQTPHTKRDLEWRSVRSAAPTPDTAAIGKRFEFPFGGDDDEEEAEDEEGDHGEADLAEEEEEDDEEDEDDEGEGGLAESAKPVLRQATAGAEESEFRKWFYENRGDLNRSWKKRRREEKKLTRQRESRRLGRKLA